MGGGPRKDKKFIQKIMQQIKDGKTELFVVNDKFGTPTYTYDFARNVNLLLQTKFWGVYNMVCGGVTSRLEVVRELRQFWEFRRLCGSQKCLRIHSSANISRNGHRRKD